MSPRRQQRCAIYTRKSSEEGLEQDFNSLDAQREACHAFILSQRHEGWAALSTQYDDGGFSGGSMSRPALERLLQDVKTGRIDVVVVYKVDRLTRSLTDFARIVEVFDAHGVSFVSVTQQFNTTSSMGRLTLNVLLSFAQFEREVTAERIRDKIAASKQKGLWMGGLPPLGYDVRDKQLVVNDAEAEVVREVFRLYLEVGSVRRLKEALDRRGMVTKPRCQADGREMGGKRFSRGHLYALLSNPLYVGKVRHRGVHYAGRHEPIVDEATFAAVQARLAAQAPSRQAVRNEASPHLLTGMLFDESGDRLSPTHAVKQGRRYRYYVSHRLIAARRKASDGWRLPADEIEQLVLREFLDFLGNPARLVQHISLDIAPAEIDALKTSAVCARDVIAANESKEIRALLRTVLHRVEVHPDGIRLELSRHALKSWMQGNLQVEHTAEADEFEQTAAPIILSIDARLQRRGVEARFVLKDGSAVAGRPDANLITLIARAHYCLSLLTTGGLRSMNAVGKEVSLPASEVSRILPLAFLAPDIVRAILAGEQPVTLTAERLKRLPLLAFEWLEQRKQLGFDGPAAA
jgi:site-specific DNA recombinase